MSGRTRRSKTSKMVADEQTSKMSADEQIIGKTDERRDQTGEIEKLVTRKGEEQSCKVVTLFIKAHGNELPRQRLSTSIFDYSHFSVFSLAGTFGCSTFLTPAFFNEFYTSIIEKFNQDKSCSSTSIEILCALQQEFEEKYTREFSYGAPGKKYHSSLKSGPLIDQYRAQTPCTIGPRTINKIFTFRDLEECRKTYGLLLTRELIPIENIREQFEKLLSYKIEIIQGELNGLFRGIRNPEEYFTINPGDYYSRSRLILSSKTVLTQILQIFEQMTPVAPFTGKNYDYLCRVLREKISTPFSDKYIELVNGCLLYTSPSPRD